MSIYCYEVDEYLKSILVYLKYHENGYDIKFEFENDISNNRNRLGIVDDDINSFMKEYHISNLYVVLNNYLCYPEELLNATLRTSSLDMIGVNKEKLKISTNQKRISGSTDIEVSNKEYAIDWTRSYLKNCGYTDIKILSTFFNSKTGVGGFNAHYEAKNMFEKVNVKEYKIGN